MAIVLFEESDSKAKTPMLSHIEVLQKLILNAFYQKGEFGTKTLRARDHGINEHFANPSTLVALQHTFAM